MNYPDGHQEALAHFGVKEAFLGHAFNRLEPNQQTNLAALTGGLLGAGAAYGAHKFKHRYLAPDKDERGNVIEPTPVMDVLKGGLMGAAGGVSANALFTPAKDPNKNKWRQSMLPEQYQALADRFGNYQKDVHAKGVYSGTGHKRITIPKKELAESEIRALGFQPVTLAIPESGQDRFTSYRHRDNNYHIHSHPDYWTMHEDAHPSMTMLMQRTNNPLERMGTIFTGLPHILTEGVPGAFIYGKEKLKQLLGYRQHNNIVDDIHSEMGRPLGHVPPPQPPVSEAPPELAKAAGYAGGAFEAQEEFGLKLALATPPAPTQQPVAPAPEDKPQEPQSTWKRWLPAAGVAGAAGLAGLGAYKYLRAPSYSHLPAVRQMQQTANQGGFHRVVDSRQYQDYLNNPGFFGKLRQFLLSPQMNDEGVLTGWNRAKFHLLEGTGAIPVGSDQGKQWVALPGYGKQNAGKPIKVDGVVFNRNMEAAHGKGPMSQVVQGGIDAEGPPDVQYRLTELAQRLGKAEEGRLLMKHMPDHIPETLPDMDGYYQRVMQRMGAPITTPEQRQQAARHLQEDLKGHFGEDNYVLKTNKSVQSRGAFPWARDRKTNAPNDWAQDIKKYDELYTSNPEFKAFVDENNGQDFLAPYLREHGALEGYTLHRFLADPKTVHAQRGVPSPLGEYRVHAMNGMVPENMVVNRSKNVMDHLWDTTDRGAMSKFVEEALSKLPEEYRQGTFGMDVMPFRKPDGSVGFKIVELNPTETYAPEMNTVGGGSGMFKTYYDPRMGHKHIRNMTGRWDPVVAGMGAAGAAGLAGTGAHLMLRPGELSEEDKEQVHA